MNKKFRLPRAFATIWLEALRNNTYQQGLGQLAKTDFGIDEGQTLENTRFCCLGVAGNLCGYPIDQLSSGGNYYLGDQHLKAPEEIRDAPAENNLVYAVANLNDGVYKKLYFDMFKNEYNFRQEVLDQELEPDRTKIQLSFPQIANFIEDNCEFYDA